MKNDTYAYDVSSLDGFSFRIGAHDLDQPFQCERNKHFARAGLHVNVCYTVHFNMNLLEFYARNEQTETRRKGAKE